MKKILAIALTFVMGFGVSEAQLVKSRTFNSVEQAHSGYNRLTIGYDGVIVSSKGYDSETLSGVELMYNHGLSLTGTTPLFLEIGVGASYNAKNDFRVVRVKVPVSVAYKWACTDVFSLQPYTGINFKGNVGIDDAEDIKKFQMGWQVGVGFNISKLYLGVEYDLDFMPLYDEGGYKINSSDLAVKLGFTF